MIPVGFTVREDGDRKPRASGDDPADYATAAQDNV